MNRLIHRLFIVTFLLFSAFTYAKAGPLFKISESGAPASADIILCLNGNGPMSCQQYHVSAQSLAITTTIDRSYPFVGMKIVTPGFQVTGCRPSANGYCVFAANGNTPASLTLEDTTVSNYTVGGQVNGLLGTVVLENNGNELLSISADGAFTFPTALSAGSTYSVTVQTQPATQTCTVTQGSGTITNANVTNVAVTCSTNTRTVGGSVSGLTVSESVVLQNNGGDNLSLSANGGFTFNTPVAQGATYNVTVLTQPSTQTCTVTNASGTAGASNITNVQVTCATNAYTVGGTISGLSGTTVLQNNGGDNLSVSANGSFAFPTPVAQGASYAVTVLSSPGGQVCSVTANGSGTMGGSNVTNVVVDCASNTVLTSSISSLALSVTGRTEYGVSGTPASGVARVITITNSGSDVAIGLQVAYSGLPTGTTHTGTCDGLTTLAASASCTIQINPGANATSNNSGAYVSCTNGTAPFAGTVSVSAANASAVPTSVMILDYKCIYQGGYVFAFNDTTTTAGSVGGKVMSTTDQAAVSPNGIVWSSNGTTGNGSSGTDFIDLSPDIIPGISNTSTSSSSNPSYFTFDGYFTSTYTNPNPFSTSFNACNGNLDGQCNTGNIVTFYNQFITNYVYPGTAVPFTATPGPTTLTYYAAGLCKGTISSYSDWYLPAICELGFDRTGTGSGCGSAATPTLQNILSNLATLGVPTGVYWSSTEFASTPQVNAWDQNFAASNNQGGINKAAQLGVRCVRSLTY